MNIFVLDEDPEKAVKMLCDCHLRKMCVETAQILSGVMIRKGIRLDSDMPKPQNVNHPVIVAVDTMDEINWLCVYNSFLHFEYLKRFEKVHAYEEISWYYRAYLVKGNNEDCTELAKCCGDMDVSDMDIVTAYRKYYVEVKKPQLTAKGLWKFTNREDWTEKMGAIR